MSKVSLILGAGHTKTKSIDPNQVWEVVITLDMEKQTNPDIVHDLNYVPWPMLLDNQFDEVHAYEVLEHFGQQGDFRALFAHFGELWRILKPGGKLFATCPASDSVWAWGDPGHTRIINEGTLVFLQRKSYQEQLGITAMSDYRRYLVGDWKIEAAVKRGQQFQFIMQAIK